MGRFGFVAARLAQTVLVLLGVVLIVFLLLSVAPGDAARDVAGLRATPEEVAAVRADLGLDRSFAGQYVDYLGGLLQGDLGYSYKSQEPVGQLIGGRLEVTAWLLGATVVLTVLVTVPLAVHVALRQGSWIDHAVRFLGLIGIGMPAFWIGTMLLLLIALPTGILPVGGFGETTAEKLRSIVLPAVTLTLGAAPILIRSLRAEVIAVLGTDQVTTARSLGVPRGWLIRRFVLRNALVPSLNLLALEVGYLLFGAVVVETTFALPGIGEGLVLAGRARDIPSIQGYTLVFAMAVVTVFLLVDVLTAMLDPRVEITA